MQTRLDARFTETAGRRVFSVVRAPSQGTGVPYVLIVPPFGEEMNKCRRMVALAAQALAAAGIASCTPDLSGTGDSSGEFSQARWQHWLEDLRAAHRSMTDSGFGLGAVLAVRLGACLAADLLRIERIERPLLLLWQPVFDGRRFVEQFLRIRVAASLMEDDRKETVAQLRARIAAGEALDVAGYALTSGMVEDLDRASFETAFPARGAKLVVFETKRSVDAPFSVPLVKSAEGLRAAGAEVELRAVTGDPFWTSTEIVVLPQLVAESVAILAATR